MRRTLASAVRSLVAPLPAPIVALVVVTLAAPLVASLAAADWPQYLGPERNGVYRGPAIADTFDKGGPRIAWRRTLGQGFAGPAVAGNRVLVFHRVGSEEVLESLDAATGKTQWRHTYATRYQDDFGFDAGPRAVPVVVNNIVYTFGAEGQLRAVDLATGKLLWSEDTSRRFAVAKGFFGAGGSPLIEDGRVIANIGGSKAGIVAFEARTGKVLWTATSDGASYSSGVGATIGGRRVAVFLTREGLVGLDPTSGRVAFQQRWRSRSATSVNAATPVVVGNRIFVSAEYGPGAGVLEVDGAQLKPVWASDDVLTNHYATSVHLNGTLYGFHGRQEQGPSLRAVDFATGKVLWSEEQFRGGTVILANDKLVILRESGELVIAPASPQAFRPTARARILTGVARPYPALADGFLYARTERDERTNESTLVCVDLRR
jgi:outer membrane protein assembly factor BamB